MFFFFQWTLGSVIPLLGLIQSIVYVVPAMSHGHLADPPPRGALAGSSIYPSKPFDASAPRDFKLFFPAGSRNSIPGSGLRSQIAAAHRRWTDFLPMKPGFAWSASVCGDLKGGGRKDHLRGGRYYYGAKIVRNYSVGARVSFEASVVAHHNGFFEFHMCNMARCPRGDLSAACFRIPGACRQLQRAPNWICDSGWSRKCGPIDKKYPGRWYVPCPKRSRSGSFDIYGTRGTMRYLLPKGFVCNHCVLHWYYASADHCNPPGVIEYFTGQNKPRKWGSCPGGGGAQGGFASDKSLCTNRGQFSEEYYNCADVRIVGAAGQKPRIKKGNRRQNHIVNKGDPFILTHIGFVRQRKFVPLRQLRNVQSISMPSLKGLTFRTIFKRPIQNVRFFLRRETTFQQVGRFHKPPYYFFGRSGAGVPKVWRHPIQFRYFAILIRAHGYQRVYRVRLINRPRRGSRSWLGRQLNSTGSPVLGDPGL